MSHNDHNPLIGPNQLINSIASFAESVTRYLSPVVRFVGHKDDYYDSLYRKFPDLEQEKRYSGKPAHLVVFDEVPEKHLGTELSLPCESAYVMCLDENDVLNQAQRAFMKSRISATLHNPTVDELHWHTKALLMIQDVSYCNGEHSYPELMSVDGAFRSSLANLIISTVNSKSCIAFVESESFRSSLVDFLFSALPSLLSPFKISFENIDFNSLPNDRLALAVIDCNSQTEVQTALNTLKPGIDSKSIIAVIKINPEANITLPISDTLIHFNGIEYRKMDTLLMAYWCAMYRSSEFEKPRYYSEEQINHTMRESSFDSKVFVESLINQEPSLIKPNEHLIDLVLKYDRPSIDDIFNEAERRVMRSLYSRADIAEAASSAAGIPAVTFRKRLKRLAEKESFLGLITDSVPDS